MTYFLTSNELCLTDKVAICIPYSKRSFYHGLYYPSCCISHGLVNKRWRFSTTHSSGTSKPIFMRLEYEHDEEKRKRTDSFMRQTGYLPKPPMSTYPLNFCMLGRFWERVIYL